MKTIPNMSSNIVNMSKNNIKLMVTSEQFETTLISDCNLIHIIILKISPVDIFIRGFWRSIPALNKIVFTCISYNIRRKSKLKANSNSRNRDVHYISVVSPSPQLTSSSSSSSPDTSSSIVSSNSSERNSSIALKMAPNDTSTHTQPSAPSPGLVLFNSEEHSDIVFLVGNEPDPIWRFPAHSFIVENASPIFKAIVETERNGEEKQLSKRITWCRPEIFHIILRHMYTNEITISSVSNALVLFTAANQFLLNDLSRICLTFLYENCNEENVLEMIAHFSQFSYLRLSSTTPQNLNTNDSIEGSVSRQSSHQYSNNCDNILNELIIRCYRTLDSEANKIVSSSAFSNLDHDLIVKILSRDTLHISSELEVFECIMRWSCQQCQKQCKQLTSDNKRNVLGKALYCPRYLTMTVDEFMRGPHISDVLTEEEKCSLLAKLMGEPHIVLPVHLSGRKLDMARKYVEQVSGDDMTASTSSATNGSNAGIIAKKKSTSKKLLNGLGDLVICVIRLLD